METPGAPSATACGRSLRLGPAVLAVGPSAAPRRIARMRVAAAVVVMSFFPRILRLSAAARASLRGAPSGIAIIRWKDALLKSRSRVWAVSGTLTLVTVHSSPGTWCTWAHPVDAGFGVLTRRRARRPLIGSGRDSSVGLVVVERRHRAAAELAAPDQPFVVGLYGEHRDQPDHWTTDTSACSLRLAAAESSESSCPAGSSGRATRSRPRASTALDR
jgi:hypothetical protein